MTTETVSILILLRSSADVCVCYSEVTTPSAWDGLVVLVFRVWMSHRCSFIGHHMCSAWFQMTQTHRLLRTHILCITNPRVWNDRLVSRMLLIVRLYGMQRSLLALAKKTGYDPSSRADWRQHETKYNQFSFVYGIFPNWKNKQFSTVTNLIKHQILNWKNCKCIWF